MYSVTLVSVCHLENGQCNSNELYKILQEINPEVIFDELPSRFFDLYYGEMADMYFANSILLNRKPLVVPLEVRSVRMYRQNYDVEIIPVDIDVRQKLSKYQDDFLFMIGTFFKYEDYKKLDDEREILMVKHGFHFLNSDEFMEFLDKKEAIERKIIESEVHNDKLLNIYKLFHKEQYDNREEAMLQNIYNYSKKNQYNRAVFLIGAEHKKSIMQKITKWNKLSEIKLNWIAYTNK